MGKGIRLWLYLILIAGIATMVVAAKLSTQIYSKEALEEKEYLLEMLKEITFEKKKIEDELKNLKSKTEKTESLDEKDRVIIELKKEVGKAQLSAYQANKELADTKEKMRTMSQNLAETDPAKEQMALQIGQLNDKLRKSEEQLLKAADINSSLQKKLIALAKLLAIEPNDTDKEEAAELSRRLESMLNINEKH